MEGRHDGRQGARRSAAGTGPATRPARRGRERTNDRPYVLILLALLVVIGAMALGPVRSLGEANDRVGQLTAQRDVLAADVERLDAERDDLNDPAEQEVYAREQLGLVRPGEQPYVVLPGEDTAPDAAGPTQRGATAGDDADDADRPWYRRLVDAVGSVFGG